MPVCPAFLPCSTPPDAQRSNGTQLMEDFMRRQQGGATPGAEVRAGAAAAATAAIAFPRPALHVLLQLRALLPCRLLPSLSSL
jgi:hypothetical protein